MNVRKVLKGYLIFTLSITMLGGMYQNKEVNSYVSTNLASVVHMFESVTDSSNYKYSKPNTGTGSNSMYASIANLEFGAKKRTIISKKKNFESVDFEISGDRANAYAVPGETAVELMKLEIVSKAKDVNFNGVKFLIGGVSPEMIDAAYLVDDEGNLVEAKHNGEYLVFKGIGTKIEAESNKSYSVKLDVNPAARTGSRVHLDIEAPDDLELFVEGEQFELSGNYPINGQYLSIVRPRPWSKSPFDKGE